VPFLVHKIILEWVFLWELQFYPFNNIPYTLQTQIHSRNIDAA